jgi:hypothetical protein
VGSLGEISPNYLEDNHPNFHYFLLKTVPRFYVKVGTKLKRGNQQNSHHQKSFSKQQQQQEQEQSLVIQLV